MTPNGLTVLAPVRAGEEAPLRAVLSAIGSDVKGKQAAGRRAHIDFPRSGLMHFARFALLDDPDRGPARRRLLFASIYDGSLDDHLAELTALTSGMPEIWGRCEGYTSEAGFPAFVRAHALPSGAFYIAFRDGSLRSIRQAVDRRAALSRAGHPATAAPFGARIANGIAWLVRAAPVVGDLLRALLRLGPANVLWAGKTIVATLGRFRVLRWFNTLTGNRLPPRQSPYSSVAIDDCAAPAPLAPGDEVSSSAIALGSAFREDTVTQNQLTLVTVVDPRYRGRAAAVLAAIDAYAKRLSPPGSLVGISTIHFVRWLLIDDGRRLVMLSDYDGSWEAYIDEFAEMILSGLDAIWSTSLGFPPDGARDLPAFKRFLRSHQVPADVFYSGYPDETVLNMLNDRALAGAGGGRR